MGNGRVPEGKCLSSPESLNYNLVKVFHGISLSISLYLGLQNSKLQSSDIKGEVIRRLYSENDETSEAFAFSACPFFV